jgi:hypothetical protein
MISYLGSALALLAAPASAEMPAASAKSFVDRLYGNVGPAVPESQIYAPDLARLIARAEAVAGRTEDPDLVGDALCGCQNLEELRARSTVVSATSTSASVRVLLTGSVDGPSRFLLKLVRSPNGWRLADSIAEPGGSYAANLRAELAGK